MNSAGEKPGNFVEEIVDADNAARRWGTWPDGRPRVHTRFPPEPNGYLHIGHAKSIWLNYGLAERYGGKFNLRFDDTNPVKEEQEYVDAIVRDVRWLGAKWVGMREVTGGTPVPPETPVLPEFAEAGVIFSSDYFQQMHDYAVELIKKGKAYVCDLSAEETSKYRGTLTSPGRDSPSRGRSVDENLELFERMRRGEFPDGSRTLRAKIDMAHPNITLRDPVMYRILHAEHHRTGGAWCIYPMYDWAHGIEDSIEGITHSICTLEFENHRPLYDWFLDAINEGRTDDSSGPWGRRIPHPRQIEFARLELTHTIMSKRKLLELVKGGHVRGWNDPRMPTLNGLRRRGYTPEAIRDFCADVGVAKFNSTIEIVRLENALRNQLNKTAPRRMAVLRPLKLVITNFPESEPGTGSTEDKPGAQATGSSAPIPRLRSGLVDDANVIVDWLDAVNNPEDASAGTRKVPFSRVLYIERDDFREEPPKGFHRLYVGNEVRLRYAFFVRCTGFTKDPATGEVTEVQCTYDPATRGGDAPDGRKVKGTIHWVSAAHAIDAEIRLYDHLFSVPDPEQSRDRDSQSRDREGAGFEHGWLSHLNPASLETLAGCKLEPSLADARVTRDAFGTIHPDRFQFERHGYFCVDPDSAPGKPVFNRTVPLKDTWAKMEKKK